MVVHRRFSLAGRTAFTARIGASLLIAAALSAASLIAALRPSPSYAAPEAAAPTAQIRVVGAWIPQPPPGAEVAAAYFTLRNIGREPAVLVGVDSPLAAVAMLHETSVVAGVSRMRPVARLTILPGRSVTLRPDGLHVMLNGLARALAVGERVPLVLHFAGGQEVRTAAQVRPLGSQ